MVFTYTALVVIEEELKSLLWRVFEIVPSESTWREFVTILVAVVSPVTMRSEVIFISGSLGEGDGGVGEGGMDC